MKITILGTSSMVPTKERNVTAFHLDYNGEGLLFDCGEGTQRQMNIAGINRMNVRKIFITHWHADHTAGLLGLIQTLSNHDIRPKIDLYGPVESKKRVQHMLDSTYFDMQLELTIHEIEAKKQTVICDTEHYTVEALELEHGIPCLGFRFTQKDKRRIKVKEIEKLGISPGPILAQFQRGESVTIKGKKIEADDVTTIVRGKVLTYIPDTAFCQNAITLACESDLIISEATYAQKHEELAHNYNHMTSTQAAQIAALSNSKRLVLLHLSQRYKTYAELLEDAQAVFPASEVAFDFLEIKL